MALLIIDHGACIKFIRNSRSYLLPKKKMGKIFIVGSDTVRISTDCCMNSISFHAKDVRGQADNSAAAIVNYLNNIASENLPPNGDGNNNP